MALSRAISISGLYLLNLNPKKICANEKVKKQMQHMLSTKCLDTGCAPVSGEAMFRLALLNVRSLKRHYLDVCNDPALSTLDVVALTETWLKSPDDSGHLNIGGYTLCRADRHISNAEKVRGGGVATYVRNMYHCDSHPLSRNGIEALCLTCTSTGEGKLVTVKIVVLYRAPHVKKKGLDVIFRGNRPRVGY